MTLIAVTATKHSPGATTLALALAAARADESPMLVEADPAGGDLAVWTGSALEPGLMTLAAAARRDLKPELVDTHTQTLGNGVSALLASTSPTQASSALIGLAEPLAEQLRSGDRLVVVDCGRWFPATPAGELLRDADVVLIAFRPTMIGVEHLRTRLGAIDDLGRLTIAVSVGQRPYGIGEISAVVPDIPIYAVAEDRRGAAALASGAPVSRWLARTPLIRSTSALLDELSGRGSEVVRT